MSLQKPRRAACSRARSRALSMSFAASVHVVTTLPSRTSVAVARYALALARAASRRLRARLTPQTPTSWKSRQSRLRGQRLDTRCRRRSVPVFCIFSFVFVMAYLLVVPWFYTFSHGMATPIRQLTACGERTYRFPQAARARDMTAETPKITALTPAQAAKILATAAGSRRITEAMVRADIDAGAPTNADGTVNLVHYAAWLVREVAGGD